MVMVSKKKQGKNKIKMMYMQEEEKKSSPKKDWYNEEDLPK